MNHLTTVRPPVVANRAQIANNALNLASSLLPLVLEVVRSADRRATLRLEAEIERMRHERRMEGAALLARYRLECGDSMDPATRDALESAFLEIFARDGA